MQWRDWLTAGIVLGDVLLIFTFMSSYGEMSTGEMIIPSGSRALDGPPRRESVGRVQDGVMLLLTASPVLISHFLARRFFFIQHLCTFLFSSPVSHAPAELLRTQTTQRLCVHHSTSLITGESAQGYWRRKLGMGCASLPPSPQ